MREDDAATAADGLRLVGTTFAYLGALGLVLATVATIASTRETHGWVKAALGLASIAVALLGLAMLGLAKRRAARVAHEDRRDGPDRPTWTRG